MSENMITFGLMAELEVPVAKEARDFVSERMDEVGLGLNYEGTLIYSTTFHKSLHEGFDIHFPSVINPDTLYNKAWNLGFAVKQNTITPFFDLWYNGTDSNHADITLEQFRAKVSAG